MRIACWSGPRNLSTAMMYAFGNRADFAAVDEPFYAAYLARTGKPHPMAADVMVSQPQDPEAVIRALTGPVPGGKPHVWQKHMAQHMLPGIPRGWIAGMTNVFLIRHPARVVASFARGYEQTGLEDIGILQQAELFDALAAAGAPPVVVESADIRAEPEGTLRALCHAIGLDWDPAVLSWPAGPRAEDGVWAPVWYGSVHASTGFAGAEGPLPEVEDASGRAVIEAALPIYERLHALRLRA